MKSNLLTLVALCLILFSCEDNDEISPEMLIQDQWLNVNEFADADQPYEIMYSIDFQSGGKVYMEAIVRDMETKNVLGFLEYYNGNYQLIENKIAVSITEHYYNLGGTFYSDKEKLSLVDIENQTREFQLRNKNSELHTIMPIYASSLGIIYKRIEQ